MFFRLIDKFFDKIKYLLIIITFILILLASYMFIYWLLFSAKVPLPEWLSVFSWGVIDMCAFGFKNTPLYKEIIPILPVLASGVFIIATYLINCLYSFLESNHRKYQACVENYKEHLASNINKELHNDFIKDLKRTAYMLVKIKIVVKYQKSYLTAMTDTPVDENALAKKIENEILASVNSPAIQKKGMQNDTATYLITNFEQAHDFFVELVNQSSRLISKEIKPKVDIGFYCAAQLFNDLSEASATASYVDRMIDMKITNKIVVTPRFKVYFENIFPDSFYFSVQGEYNLSEDPDLVKNIMIYSIKKKS